MNTPLPVSRTALRRFLLDSQHLWSPDPSVWGEATKKAVLEMIRRLECIQLDPVAAVERNQHLVLAARIPGYRPHHLEELLRERHIFEYWTHAACVIPIEDYPVFQPVRERIKERLKSRLDLLQPVVHEVLNRLEKEGPLPSRAFQSKDRVHGFWDNQVAKTKATSLVLNLLADCGILQVVRRKGAERFFDLAHRAVPADLFGLAEIMDPDDIREALLQKYLRAVRVFDPGDPRFSWRKMSAAERRAEIARRVEAGTVVPLAVEGVRRTYHILAEDLDRLREHQRNDREESQGPVRFLPPLDNLLWRRERIVDLFGFDYKWEIYLPRHKRRYGYYAMPILAGDRLIGRMDPRLDREHRLLVVEMLQLEPTVSFTPELRRNLRHALETFARFHGAVDVTVKQTEPGGLSII